MSLSDELNILHELQKVDYQIYSRECAIKDLESGEGLKQQAIVLLKRHDVVKAELHKLEAVLKDKELELKTIEAKRAKVHEKLYSGRVNNPKELSDLEKDEQMLDVQINLHEEGVLESMEQTEQARAVFTKLTEDVDAIKRRWKATVTRTQQETARLQAEIAALRPGRDALAVQVPKPLLRRYDELRQRHDGVGMGVTGNENCPICHVRLTPQTINRLREGEDLTYCDNCGRILMWLA